MTIVVSSFVFHDQLTVVNILGLFITLSGIGFYHYMKLSQLKAKARKTAKEIAEINQSSATDRFSGSMDQTANQRHQKQRRSERFRLKSGRRTDREVHHDVDRIVEDGQERAGEALLDQTPTTTIDGTEQRNGDLLIHDLDPAISSTLSGTLSKS